MSRSAASKIVREREGQWVERVSANCDLIVLGADSDSDTVNRFDAATNAAIQSGEIEVISETEFWHRLGIDSHPEQEAILYTPRMLSDLISAPIRNVRRWIRLGLLQPIRVNHRLPYFDFEGLQNARRLKTWTDAGLSAESIVRQIRGLLDKVAQTHGYDYERWNIHLEGQALLIRDEDRWLESTGQFRLDFDDSSDDDQFADRASTICIASFQNLKQLPAAEDSGESLDQLALLQMAEQAEDEGKLSEAVEWFRVLMARFGATAELHFALAELLYRLGDIHAARERYYAALELDDEFIEARANLGCVLLETGQRELAIAAFEGVLAMNEEFPDVHYHLARALDDCDLTLRAEHHWRRFIELAPRSPWSVEASERLESRPS